VLICISGQQGRGAAATANRSPSRFFSPGDHVGPRWTAWRSHPPALKSRDPPRLRARGSDSRPRAHGDHSARHSHGRAFTIAVAGPAALIVAKLHKLGERDERDPDRVNDKDAHDVYRLLVAVSTDDLAAALRRLREDELAGPVTTQGLTYLGALFAEDAEAIGSVMAGRTEEGVGNPLTVSASAAALAEDLLAEILS
jgi:hypothetical protein